LLHHSSSRIISTASASLKSHHMATVLQKPSVDYFSLSTQKPQSRSNPTSKNYTKSPYVWDSSPYDISQPSPESVDSIVPSPTSPTLSYPSYRLPKTEDINKDQVFNFGSFDDWMGWDDPADNALSPTTDFFPELKVSSSSPMDPRPMSRGVNPSSISNSKADDTAVFGGDSLMEEPLFQSPNQPREQLYSTPLSWEVPSASSRRTATRLSPEEESKLRSIAMPSLSGRKAHSYPASPDSASSPEPISNGLKRKSSYDDDEDDDDDEPSTGGRRQPVKKTAHNMIEKRYRTNLNDKIAALRDSVPSLRIISRKNSRGEEVQEDLQGLTPAHKLNKATVLSKATEYIAHLEKRNKMLLKENSTLKSRVEAFEILMMARQNPQQQQQQSKPMQRPLHSRQGSSQRYMDGMM